MNDKTFITFMLSFSMGALFCFFIIVFVFPKVAYKNTKDFTNGSIRIEEGIEGSMGFGDTPARLTMTVPQVKANKRGVCDIKTGKTEFMMISLEHLNMLDHFAHRYLERKNNGWHGGCRLVIEGKEVEGKNIK